MLNNFPSENIVHLRYRFIYYLMILIFDRLHTQISNGKARLKKYVLDEALVPTSHYIYIVKQDWEDR